MSAGFGSITPVKGLSALGYLVANGPRCLAAAIAYSPITWSVFLKKQPAAFFEGFSEVPHASSGPAAEDVQALAVKRAGPAWDAQDILAGITHILEGIVGTQIDKSATLLEASHSHSFRMHFKSA